ncbi:MAG: translesion error-prone DNA polymerase V autoproteolytic subunit [Xanthomonadaceae bacterium]|nr:translesion error-prone DNA polymerase V autoproteolytic subunit [Xanthomonadaceae bacterium]
MVRFNKLYLPLFLGRVPAGFPSPADDYIDKTIDLNELMVKRPAATFFVRASGDSMLGAGIHTGDILVVDRSINPASRMIVVVHLNGEFMVKRLVIQKGLQQLVSENPKYKSRTITESDEFEIWGVVTYVVHPAK